MQKWDECGCDTRPQGRENKPGEKSWEWGGCSEHFQYGRDFSKHFMKPGKNTQKLAKFIIDHNNEAGRKVCQVVVVVVFVTVQFLYGTGCFCFQDI